MPPSDARLRHVRKCHLPRCRAAIPEGYLGLSVHSTRMPRWQALEAGAVNVSTARFRSRLIQWIDLIFSPAGVFLAPRAARGNECKNGRNDPSQTTAKAQGDRRRSRRWYDGLQRSPDDNPAMCQAVEVDTNEHEQSRRESLDHR